MQKKHIFTICLFTLFFCKKKQSEEKKTMNSQDFFSRMTDVNKFDKLERTSLNDSTDGIRGVRDSLVLTGYLTKNNEKVDWWKIIHSGTNKELAILQYRLIDNKEFINQFKVFNNDKLDVYRSKYYTFNKDKENEKISYSFNIPKSENITKSKGKFLYFVYDVNTNEEIINSECEFVNSDNIFSCSFSIPSKNNIAILGVFWEVSEFKNGLIAGSEIYVRDTLSK